MRLLTKLSAAVLLSVFMLVFAQEARADGVALVTAGSGTTGNLNGGGFTLIGQNFTLNVGYNFGPGVSPMRPGETVHFRVFNLGLDLRGGPGVVNGVSYNTLSYLGQLSISTSVAIPLGGAPGVLTLTAPFTLSGHLQGCTTHVMSGCPPGFVFDSQVLGQGIATITLTGFLNGDGRLLYSLNNIRYDIQAPVPEPATLLLFGTALAALGGAKARRRRRPPGTQ